MADATVVADGLFTWPSDDPRLIGVQCAACGLIGFPAAATCSSCASDDLTSRPLSPRGTLWTFTTQGFRPPSPPYDGNDTDSFEPYAVGYVELPDGVFVEGRLTEPDPRRLRIGQPMRLTIVPYTHEPDGAPVLTFAFEPDTDEPDTDEPGTEEVRS
jgi:uncharacterized OB-fold protein